MQALSTEELKEVEIDILKHIDMICRQNGLRYFISGGTLIGAVRHRGFIPWDDDIDIDMPRDDYMKLIQLMKNEKRYKLISHESPQCYFSYGKVIDTNTYLVEHMIEHSIKDMGVFIDIFPLDGLPDDPKKAKRHFMKGRRLCEWMIFYALGNKTKMNSIKNIVIRALGVLCKFYGIDRIQKKILKIAEQYRYDDSKLVCALGGGYGIREIYPRRYFDTSVELEFGGNHFFAPGGYDEFLRQMYGDYMKLPPAEQRKTNHDFDVYWRDDVK